jgi:hypothetical protein
MCTSNLHNKTKLGGKKREYTTWWCTTQGNHNEISRPKWKGCTTKDTMAKGALTYIVEKYNQKKKWRP